MSPETVTREYIYYSLYISYSIGMTEAGHKSGINLATNTPYNEMSIVSILENTDRVIVTQHCIEDLSGTAGSCCGTILPSWWCHQIETFSTLLALCAGNSSITGEFPSQRPVTWSFDVFFDLRLNKRLSKQLWGWWFEMPSCSLWHHCNYYRLTVKVLEGVCNAPLATSHSRWPKLMPHLTYLMVLID